MLSLTGRAPDKGQGPERMKWMATALLILVTVLFFVSRVFERRYPGLAVVCAFAEAAMVGALADWFAVVALFRHPLGVPIPHTAIIPKNKGRIADNLGDFIAGNFLGTGTILARIRAFDPAARLAQWLAKREAAEMVATYTAKGMVFWLDAVEDQRVQRFLHETVLARLESANLARLAGELLDVLTQDGRHQQLLDKAISLLGGLLRHKTIRAAIADRIAADLGAFLKTINYNNFLGHYVARKLIAGAERFLKEVADSDQHELRHRFDLFIRDFIVKLKSDPEFRIKAEQIRDELLGRPEIADYLKGLWTQLRTWLRNDLQSADSSVRSHVADAVSDLGGKLRGDPGMQAWINEKILAAAGPLVEQNRAKAGRFIAEQVKAWDERHMVRQLELSIGRDLQFIRINGTLVGGLVGLLIFGLTRFMPA